jgi:hypothetical protein
MKIKHIALGCSLFALSFTGYAHAQDVKSQITTQYIGTKLITPLAPIPKNINHIKRHYRHQHRHHHCICKHEHQNVLLPVSNPKSGVALDGSVFIPNYSRVISKNIINQGSAGWDYLGQHKIGYKIIIVEGKTPYYYSYENMINSIADKDKTSLGSSIENNMVIVNDSPVNIINGIKDYTKDKKLSAQKVLAVETWTGESVIYGKKTIKVEKNTNKKTEDFSLNNTSLTLSGNVYGQDYVDMNILLKNESENIDASDKIIQSVKNERSKESVNFHTNIKSGSTFIYQLPPIKKHKKAIYVLITPEVIPVTY